MITVIYHNSVNAVVFSLASGMNFWIFLGITWNLLAVHSEAYVMLRTAS